jgi:hypothetical protein
MGFTVKKEATPQLVDALWDFLKADTPKKLKATTKKLKKEWNRKPKQRKVK